MNTSTPQSPEQTLKTAKIVWIVFCGTIGFFIYSLNQMTFEGEAIPLNINLLVVFGVLAVIMAVGSFHMRKFFFKKRDSQKWFQGNIFSWVMNEAIGLLGFSMAVQHHDPRIAYPFFAVSLFLTLIMPPKLPEGGFIS